MMLHASVALSLMKQDLNKPRKCSVKEHDAGQFGTDYNEAIKVDSATEFCGYTSTSALGTVDAMFVESRQVESLL